MPIKSNAAEAYHHTQVAGGTLCADPHSLITQMFDGALTRISRAQGAIQRGEIATKGEQISKAVMIIGGLEGCIDHQRGGELADNLSRLYQYMGLALTEANIHNDLDKLAEVSRLLLEIKSAWVQIPREVQQLASSGAEPA